ncbi:YdcF family protein [Nocardia rhizosphaerihabitans]|uniref:YdcF family protein n=1 Tax=Nocardia rhizosphaerihabitans TaxID=1691570 RepID=UPI003670D878
MLDNRTAPHIRRIFWIAFQIVTALAAMAIFATALTSPPVVVADDGSGESRSRVIAPLGFRGPETAIVILGYGLLPDGTMRPELIERLTAGYIQSTLAPLSPVIVTGGNPCNGVTEADAMADWLTKRGLPWDRIHIEPNAHSTVENAVRSAQILQEIGARDAVVVTSADHVDRAVMNFNDAGVQVISAVTPEQIPLIFER